MKRKKVLSRYSSKIMKKILPGEIESGSFGGGGDSWRKKGTSMRKGWLFVAGRGTFLGKPSVKVYQRGSEKEKPD